MLFDIIEILIVSEWALLWIKSISLFSWELDYKEGWVPKNWCFQIVVLEKILESPLDCREIKLVNPKGSQLWIFTGRTDAEAEAPILWLPDARSWLIGKDPDAGKDWGQEEKGMTEDEMVGWHHWLNGHEFEQALGMFVFQSLLFSDLGEILFHSFFRPIFPPFKNDVFTLTSFLKAG